MKKGLLSMLLWCCAFSMAQAATITRIDVGGIDGELQRNVNLYLAPLKNEESNSRTLNYARTQIIEALKALGYYRPTVRLSVQNQAEGDILSVVVQSGEPTRIGELAVAINGAGKEDTALIKVLESLPLRQGEIVNHGDYDAARSAIESALLELGYFDAKWQAHALNVTRATSRADVHLEVDSGPRYAFGPIEIIHPTPAEAYVRELAPFEIGEPYLAGKVSEYNLRLNRTPYFVSTRVYPDIAARNEQGVPVRVEVIHKPGNSFEVGGGYSTDLGPKIRLKWSKPWIGKGGHYLESNLNVSEPKQDISFSYTIPVSDPTTDIWRYSLGYKLEDKPQLDIFSKTVTGQIQRQWLVDGGWTRTAFLRREYEYYDIQDEHGNSQMLLPGISYARKRSKGGTTPYWGEQWMGSLEFGLASFASSANIVRARLQHAWLRQFAQKHLVFARVNAGAMWVDNIDDVPVSLRFFAGGDQSIRGFAFESISPEKNGRKRGGKYLLTGSLEYNYQFAEKWRAALFVDSGTATNDFSESFETGAGFGFRYLTPVGPVRFDHAWALTSPNYTTRLSITLGPEI